jgi:aryl-alcohol dehydrogenase-like predicted oxidoreductase
MNRIGLGTNRLRNTDDHVAFIRAAVDAGVQMIDTAHLYTGGESERAIGRALSSTPRARRVVPIAAVQNEYNIEERSSDDVVDYCTREGILFVPYYPLGADATRAVRDAAKRRGVTTQQVMLAWLLARSPVMLPIPGTLSRQHLRDNLASQSIELSDAEFMEGTKADSLSEHSLRTPRRLHDRARVDRREPARVAPLRRDALDCRDELSVIRERRARPHGVEESHPVVALRIRNAAVDAAEHDRRFLPPDVHMVL